MEESIAIFTLLILVVFMGLVLLIFIMRDRELVSSMDSKLSRIERKLQHLAREVEHVTTVDKRAVVDKIITCIEDIRAMERLDTLRKVVKTRKFMAKKTSTTQGSRYKCTSLFLK